MIEKIAAKHDKWIGYAKSICKNADVADDLVSEMYLRLLDRKVFESKGQVTDGYIYTIIRNLFYDQCKETAKIREGEAGYCYGITTTMPEFENIDPEPKRELPKIFTFSEKQILLMRQEKSLREIEKQCHIGYQIIKRKEKTALKKIEEWQKIQSGSAMHLQK